MTDELLLLDATSPVEREAIEQWHKRDSPLSATIALDSAQLAEHLNNGHDPLLRPVGVAWLPPEHRGRRRARFPQGPPTCIVGWTGSPSTRSANVIAPHIQLESNAWTA